MKGEGGEDRRIVKKKGSQNTSVSGGEVRGREETRCTSMFAVHVPLWQMALCAHI
jgi:hypothetical protein